jgi:hypothetical protein
VPCNGNGFCPGNGSHTAPAVQCVCVVGWDAASNCSTCAFGWDAASNCSTCAAAYSGFDCDQCAIGWRANAYGICNDCSMGYYGPNCARCPGLAGGVECSGRGVCDGSGSMEGSGVCACNSGWFGTSCGISFGVVIGFPVGCVGVAALLFVLCRKRRSLSSSPGARATAVYLANPLSAPLNVVEVPTR